MNRYNPRLILFFLLLFSAVHRVQALATFTLTTSVSPAASGTIALNPPGSVYNSNILVTLTATANPGFKFQKWSGASTAVTNRITVVMNGAKSVTAIFTKVPMFKLAKLVSPTNGGAIIALPVSATNGYPVGTMVTLTASNNPGFKFSRWSGAANTNRNPVIVSMTTNKSITAIFTNIPVFKLTRIVSPTNGGAILMSPLPGTNGFQVGTVVTLTASNYPGFKFSHWSGAVSTNRNPVAVTMTASKLITANFTNIPNYLLYVQASPSGAGAVYSAPYSSSNIYPVGTMVALTAQAYGSNIFGTWLGLPSASNQVTFAMNGNRSVTALFNNPGKLLFQNTNGLMAIWFMLKTNRLTSVSLNNGVSPGVNWRLAGAADFDNNGSKDLLLRSTSGQLALWRMAGNVKTNSTLLATVPMTYRVGALADFNGDSKADILWQHTNGTLSIWVMDVTTSTANISLPNPGAAWRAFAAACLDTTNSSPDIFLQNNSDGRVVAWLMNANGTAKTNSVVLNSSKSPGAGWTAVGATDMNDDGKTDVIFQSADSRVMVWFFNGTSYTGSTVLAATLAPSWSLRATK